MLALPIELMNVITVFAPLFTKPTWEHVKLLIAGAILSPGKRTITSALRVMGRGQKKDFQSFHRVLNRAVWSTLKASRLLLGLLVSCFVTEGPVVVGLDDTLERRRGSRIAAKGIYRDPVRSSKGYFVKASGLRWLCGMLLTEISWAGCVWALPILTVLCPSERFYQQKGRSHQTLLDRAWQIIQLIRRWLPTRELIFVGDSSFAAIDLLHRVSRLQGASFITRLRLDAALFDPAPERVPGRMGRPRLKGPRRPTLKQLLQDNTRTWETYLIEHWYGGAPREVEVLTETAVWYHTGLPPVPIRWVLIRDPRGQFDAQALLSTHLHQAPEQVLRWFVRRWRMEVTFEEARAHLGIETQRQWHHLAIARTTPALMGLFSLITLTVPTLTHGENPIIRTTAWYQKRQPSFSDAIALVRRRLWAPETFSMSGHTGDMIKISRLVLERLSDAVCYAA
jgi:hypothetical protein